MRDAFARRSARLGLTAGLTNDFYSRMRERPGLRYVFEPEPWYHQPELVVVAAVLLGICLMLVDCSAGRTQSAAAQVRQHYYRPPFVTVACTSNGKSTNCHPVYHPEQFHVLVDTEDHAGVDVQISKQQYATVADNDRVTLFYRRGKISHHWYLRRIEPQEWSR